MFDAASTYLDLPDVFYSSVHPRKASKPRLVVVNTALAAELGMVLGDEPTQANWFSGNVLPIGATPFAQAYAGHQFGHFTVLGDGRAIMLGEYVLENGTRVDIQLKGAGKTPYSRNGDGLAALGPMLREYIISEAMAHLGIPTTRSLAVTTTGDMVRRETIQLGAVLTRVAASHIRVGTFQFAALQQDARLTQSLVDYTLARHYPEYIGQENSAAALLQAVMYRQVDLIVAWMRVGFVHGVMNTDNMSIAGETIDYGPCAFIDAYDPQAVFSSIDAQGRYAFANQPVIAQWNLARFAESLLPLIEIDQAREIIDSFSDLFRTRWLTMMGSKLGMTNADEADAKLIQQLLDWMHHNGVDYTNTFRELDTISGLEDWRVRWHQHLARQGISLEDAKRNMHQVNPAVIPRNHQVERVLRAVNDAGFVDVLQEFLDVLSSPYQDMPADTPYCQPPLADEVVHQTFCGT
jgi:serine/tyrosine/threonine adenylyltransferase